MRHGRNLLKEGLRCQVQNGKKIEEMEAISAIPLPMMDRDDMLVWHFNTNGTYSVKSGYCVAHNQFLSQLKENPETSSKPKKEVWKVLWKMKVPNKIRSFWWRVCRNSLSHERESL